MTPQPTSDCNQSAKASFAPTRGSARLERHLNELHHLGNDWEEWCEVRVLKDLMPTGATLVESYLTAREIIVMGQPAADDESHNCDALGCGTLSHVLYRFPLPPNAQAQRPLGDSRKS